MLWSLWSSSSVGAWIRVVRQTGNAAPSEWLLLALGIAVLIGVGAVLLRVQERGWQLTLLGSQPAFARSAAYVIALALVLLGASRPALQQRADAAGTLVASLQVQGLNAADRETMDRGYYEGLLEAPRYTSALGEFQQPPDWQGMRFAGLTRETGDLLEFELLPNVNGIFKGAAFRTNSMGMRDAEYALSKGEGTRRIVLLGASYEMASGVEQDSGFEAIVERRLNAAYAGSATRFEILNFSVGGYSVLHNAIVAERKIADMDPDVVLFAVHRSERGRLALHLVNILRLTPHLGDPELDSIVRTAGITAGMNSADAVARVEPHFERLLRFCFQAIVQHSRRLGAVPILVYVPTTEEGSEGIPPVSARLLQLGDEAGFDTLSLGNVFAGRSMAELAVAPWDTHPNEMGHRLLADALQAKLLQHPFFRDLRTTRALVSDLSSR